MTRARLLGELAFVLLVVALVGLYFAAPERAPALAAARDWYAGLFWLVLAGGGDGSAP